MANKVPLPGSVVKPVPTAPAAAAPVPVHIGGDSLVDRLLPHIRTLAQVAAVLAVALVAFFVYRAWDTSKREAQTTKALGVLDVLAKPVQVADPANTGTPTDNFASVEARAKAALTLGADPLGPLAAARTALDAGDFIAAEAAYKKAGVTPEAQRGLGAVAEARYWAATDAAEKTRHLDAALAGYRSAGAAAEDGYHVGRVLALQGKVIEARAALEKALGEVSGDDVLKNLIEMRLGQLAKPAAPSTAAK